MSLTNTLERELRELSEAVNQASSDVADAELAFEAKLTEFRENGINPTIDDDAHAEIEPLSRTLNEKRGRYAQLRGRRDELLQSKADAGAVRELVAGAITGTRRGRKVSELMADMPEYARFFENEGYRGESRIELPRVEVLGRDEFHARLEGRLPLFGATIDAQDLVPVDQRLYPPVWIPQRTPRVFDLVGKGATNSDTIKYAKEVTHTSAAAETARGVAYSEATYDWDQVTISVADIGHFATLHRDNLADQAQLDTAIRSLLGADLMRKVDDLIVNGTGGDIEGILQTATIGSVARTTDEPILDLLHRAITNIRLNLFDDPDYIVMHPTDIHSATIEKATDSGVYQLGMPGSATPMTIWGYPVVSSTVLSQGTALVGNFGLGAMLWLRSGLTVRVSDSHSDYFTKRLVAVLAEFRGAFAAWQPKAFCEATGL